MNIGIEPCRIIESAGIDDRDAGHYSDIREDWTTRILGRSFGQPADRYRPVMKRLK